MSTRNFFRIWFCVFALFADAALANDFDCTRVVSLAPSVSELMDELTLSDRIVAVSRFDPRTSTLPQIGDLYSVNFEALLRVRPTGVLGLNEHSRLSKEFSDLGVAAEFVDHRRIGSIRDSIRQVGLLCNREREASALLSRIDKEVLQLQKQIEWDEPFRVLVVIGIPHSGDAPLFVSGSDGFFFDLLRLANATSVYAGHSTSLTELSNEAVSRLHPDRILHIVPVVQNGDIATAKMYWQSMWSGNGVSEIQVLGGYDMNVPGPNYPRALSQILGALSQHSEELQG